MAQTRLFDYAETLTSESLSLLTRDLVLPGLYRGFETTVSLGSTSIIQVTPGTLLLPNGIYVKEDATQRFTVPLPAQAGVSVQYLLICRHRIKNIVGGEAAQFLVVPANSLDSYLVSNDPNAAYSYVVVAYLNSVTSAGVSAEAISRPRPVRESMQMLADQQVFVYEKVYSVPLSEVLIRSGSDLRPVVALSDNGTVISNQLILANAIQTTGDTKLKYYKALGINLTFPLLIPNGLTLSSIYVIGRRSGTGNSDSSVIMRVFDAAGTKIPLVSGTSTVTDKLVPFAAALGFERHVVQPVLTNTVLPSHAHCNIELDILNVDFAGLIVSFRGDKPSILNTTVLSDNAIISEIVISP